MPPKFTCLEVPVEHKQNWLSKHLYFIRQGQEVRVELLNEKNGRVYAQARIPLIDFSTLFSKLLMEPED